MESSIASFFSVLFYGLLVTSFVTVPLYYYLRTRRIKSGSKLFFSELQIIIIGVVVSLANALDKVFIHFSQAWQSSLFIAFYVGVGFIVTEIISRGISFFSKHR